MRWVGLALAMLALLGGRAFAAPEYRYIIIPFPQSSTGVTAQLYTLEVLPGGGGRHPLVVISHGAPRTASDATTMSPGAYQAAATWFAEHGYVAVVPMRRGYGQTGGRVVEGNGKCESPDYVRAGSTSGYDIEAVVRYMREQSDVDPRRVVLMGHSAGGWGSVGAASRNPPGVVAMISFAGGRGSYAPDRVCTESALVDAARTFGATTHVPSLWIFAANDHFFGPALAKQMFAAYHNAGAPAEFVAAPSCWTDGHQLITRCPEDWHDLVAAFLQRTVK